MIQAFTLLTMVFRMRCICSGCVRCCWCLIGELDATPTLDSATFRHLYSTASRLIVTLHQRGLYRAYAKLSAFYIVNMT
jgi:hypothetical protein